MYAFLWQHRVSDMLGQATGKDWESCVTFNDVESTNKKQNGSKNVITNRNNEHSHRANKQNGYIEMVTDEKQHDKTQTEQKGHKR